MRLTKWGLGSAAVLAIAALLSAAPLGEAWANMPKPWDTGMQPAGNELKSRINDLHALVFWIITVITIFVGALLVVVMVKFSAKKNPVPSTTSHHTMLEIAWTVIPILILVVIAIPSFRLVFFLDRAQNPDMTLKVVAHQWYWEYAYPGEGDLAIESRMIRDGDLKPGQMRLLEVDNQVVVPVGKKIRILTNSVDVIHSFFLPNLRVKQDAVPGLAISVTFTPNVAGEYEIACAELCGLQHYKMKGALVVDKSQADFEAWQKSLLAQQNGD